MRNNKEKADAYIACYIFIWEMILISLTYDES